jgi:hypothetical protein
MRRFSGALSIIFLSLAWTATRADMLASSSFDSNPAPPDPRLTLNADGTLTADYNTLLDTDKILFPLSHPLTAADTFTINTRFKILSNNFYADPYGSAQISFGLVNSITTGTDRSTAPTAGGGFTPGDTYDMVAFDYFPNISPFYASPSLSPTIFSSRTGTEPAVPNDLYTLFGTESALNDPGESPLPLDTYMNAALSYDAATRRATLSLATDGSPLFINSGGGLDGDTGTIQLALPTGVNFSVDSYALLLWKDSWAGPEPSVRADVVFDSFSVTTAPEPASAMLLGAAVAGLLTRRPSRRR